MNKTVIKRGLVAALVAGAGMFANAAEKKVVATADADFWLGPGCESCPWAISENVTAYIKNCGLYLKGKGELAEELASDAPWTPYVDELDGAYLPRAVNVPASVAATLPISVTGGAEPSGAVSGAEPETVRIVDGKVLLGVSVCTNSEVKAIGEGEDGGWQKAAIEKAQVEEDGTVTLTVPATAEKGFMILQSGDAKIAPVGK